VGVCVLVLLCLTAVVLAFVIIQANAPNNKENSSGVPPPPVPTTLEPQETTPFPDEEFAPTPEPVFPDKAA
jgi:hypothetical protein